ncbi:hypothetical protein [Nonomuraea sp. NPDC050202]|jgi:hypothetical protein|uniref:hypothetical protein n=1 Tax=Nonomuraea sp. NPDC050202 TaxID=3155035 RepID=UPI0033DB9034
MKRRLVVLAARTVYALAWPVLAYIAFIESHPLGRKSYRVVGVSPETGMTAIRYRNEPGRTYWVRSSTLASLEQGRAAR